MGPLRYAFAAAMLASLPAAGLEPAHEKAVPVLEFRPQVDPTFIADLDACQGKAIAAPDNQRDATLCLLARRARRYRLRTGRAASPITYTN